MIRSYALIPHPHERKLLLVPDGEGWALPEIHSEKELFLLDLPRVNVALRRQFPPCVTTLSALFVREPAIGGLANLFTTESHDPEWQPPEGGRWFGRESLADLRIALPSHHDALKAWFGEQERKGPPAFEIPWWRPGWYTAAVAWIRQEMDRLGLQAIGPVEQVKSWHISALLRVPTDRGEVYFKAVPEILKQEVALAPWLAERYAGHVPTLLAVDLERHWLLMAGFRGRLLREATDDLDAWRATVSTYARMQQASVAEVPGLLDRGVTDLRLPRLAESVDALIAGCEERLRGGLHERLTRDEIARLEARAPELRELCARLDAWGLPAVLEHGDLHAGNVALAAEGPLFFDWACRVTHPFLGLGDLLADDDWWPEGPATNRELRDVYLDQWRAYGSREALLAAFRLAEPLRHLFHAVGSDRVIASYQAMLGSEEPLLHTASGWSMWQMQWGLADQLRKLISLDTVRRL
jgi:hypothetical protein